MPTPEQFAAWDQMARDIQGDRPLSELSDGEKASVMTIRAMGPSAAGAWIAQNAAFSQPLTAVIGGDNKPINVDDLPPAQREYYEKVNQQRSADAQTAAALLTAAAKSAPTIATAIVPESPNVALVPLTVPVMGTVSIGGGSGGVVVLQPPNTSAGSSGSSSPSQAANLTYATATAPAPSNKNMVIVLVVVIAVVAFALGWVTLPKIGR